MPVGWVGFGVSLERLFDRESRCYLYSPLGLHQMASFEGVWHLGAIRWDLSFVDSAVYWFLVAVSDKTGVIILFSSTLTLMSWHGAILALVQARSNHKPLRQMYSFLMIRKSYPTTSTIMLTMPAFRGLHPTTQALQQPLSSSGQLVVVTTAPCFTKHEDHSIHDGYSHRSLHFCWQEKTNQSLWFALCLYCWTIHQSQ